MTSPTKKQAPDSSLDWDKEPDLPRYRHAIALRESNPTEAFDELRDLAKLGSEASMLLLGRTYHVGAGLPQDRSLAETWYRRAMDAGSVKGGYALGILFMQHGEFQNAFEAFEHGASRGFAPSLNKLGMLYLSGDVGIPNMERGRTLLERASALGHVYGRRNLGVLFIKGKFGPLLIPRGIMLFLSALKNGWNVYMRNPNSEHLQR
jgi:TPR repeat protein